MFLIDLPRRARGIPEARGSLKLKDVPHPSLIKIIHAQSSNIGTINN